VKHQSLLVTSAAMIFMSAACKTILPASNNLSDTSDLDPSREHPCSIADKKPPFAVAFAPAIHDPAAWLNKRDLSMATSSALLSRLAYETPDTIQRTARDWGYRTIDVTVERSMQAFVASNDRCVVLSFRGTDMTSLRDWFVDMSSTRKGVNGGLIHSGFLNAYNNMHGRLIRQLHAHEAQNKILWVTGHSLGGALAGVFAYSNDLTVTRRTFAIDHVITFGQPLFVDSGLAKKMRSTFFNRYLRVVNNKDIVARVPPWFAHFGNLFWITPERVEYITDNVIVGGPLPGDGDGGINVEPGETPANLEPTREAFDEFMEATKPLASGTGRHDRPMTGLQMTDDHSMDLYLSHLSQKWNSTR
jgi:triacylglycerol lipase